MEIKYRLHKAQLQVFKDSSRFVILVAGRRFGKTILALVDLLATAFSKEKSRVWYVAPTYRQAEMIAWKMLQEMLPSELIKSKNEVRLEINLINGSEIALKGADNEDALRGVGLEFVVLDEYAMMKPNVWEEIIRPMLTDTKGRALFIGTPKGKNSLWELYLKGQIKEDGYSSYCFKTSDNPFIDPQEIEDAKKQLNERYFRQEYEASFEDYTGLIWPEFNRKHVIEPIYLPAVYQRIAAIDPAISGTTAVLKCALDEDGNLIVYEEYYEQNQRISEVAQRVKADCKWLIDPSAQTNKIQKDGKLYSILEEYQDNGISPFLAENDVDYGINRVGEYFKQNKIKIFSTCKHLIWELERYHWSEEKETSSGMMKPKPFKKDDHLCDALRYIVASRPDKSSLFVPETINPASAWGRYQTSLKEKNESKYARQ